MTRRYFLAATVSCVLIVLSLAGCYSVRDVNNTQVMTDADQAVIDAVFDHYLRLKCPTLRYVIGGNPTGALIVVRATLGPSGSGLSEFVMNKEIGDNHIPKELIADINHRNANIYTYQPTKENKSRIILSDSVPGVGFESKYPNSRGALTFWMPGYSADKKEAIFQAMALPSGCFGITCTYYLKFINKKWHVIWYQITGS